MVWDILVCTFGWVIIVCHTWSLRYHFDMPIVPNGVKVISTLVIFSAIVLTYMCYSLEQPSAVQMVGFGFLIFSFLLFWSTIKESANSKLLGAFDEKLPHGLLTSGPYAYVRHPFYSSYLILWIGWAIAAWTVWAIIPVVFMTVTYWNAARDEEAKFAKTDMADEYKAFMANTGRFFPKIFG